MAPMSPTAHRPLMVLVIALTVATALIHLLLGLSYGMGLFVLNGIGFLGLLLLMYAPVDALRPVQPAVRYVLIAYTALTLVLYFVMAGQADPLALITKAIEALLILCLVVEALRARRPAA